MKGISIHEKFVNKFRVIQRSGDSLSGLGVDIGYHFPDAIIRLFLRKILQK